MTNGLGRLGRKWGLVMVAPTMIGLLILNIVPFFYTIYLSFNSTGAFNSMQWSGLDNLKRMIHDPVVWKATSNTIWYMVLSVPLGILLAVVFAVLLNSKIKGKSIFRSIYFLPIIVAPAAIAMVWKWLLNKDYGIINYLLGLFGLHGPAWLSSPGWVLFSLSLVTIWSSVGYDIILVLSGLQSIPSIYYEAAQIDGASEFTKFFKITVPLLSPTLFFVVIMRIMAALKQFDFVYMLVGEGNPALDDAQTLTYLFYKHAFIAGDKGYASIIVLWTFLIIGAITLIQFKVQKKWVTYD